ncbi:MAG: acetate--CoA ligase [Deltaproteobacteria bacterium]|nr:acetate--CoA ligase [Deltaproteobacteria bacterium]
MAQRLSQTPEVWTPDESVTTRWVQQSYEALREKAAANPAAFWESEAKEYLWFRPWERTVDDSNAPFYQWFVGGKTNIVANALDRHLTNAHRNKLAYIWEGEDGSVRTMSFHALDREVCQFAHVLRSMGVRKGDRVTLYLPRVLELPIAMLACAKIGAVHSVVYGGFSVEALNERIQDSESRVLVTADGGFLRGKVIPLKEIADRALERAGTVEHVIVVRRTGQKVAMETGRDYFYDELMTLPLGRAGGGRCETEQMDSEDPLFLLYTSGTTGRPKGIVHTHGGYLVGVAATLKYAFEPRPEDRWWCAADPGWITGHSYVVYGPLINGMTSVIYEGAPTHPYPDRWWRIVERYGVNVLYAAPTAIRGLMRFGEAWANRHDLSSLRLLGSVGEPINPEAWRWYHRVIGGGRCPIIDTWWQTETGMFMVSPVPSMPLKPGSATRPLPGIRAEVLADDGTPVRLGEEGKLVITTPWPAMLRGVWRDPDRYVQQYWSTFPGKYFTGDSARIDEDGYLWIIGRVDDVIKVSGYRLGTAEIESALVSHPAVGEAAAIAMPHEIKGHAIWAYVLLRAGHQPSPALAEELGAHVAREMGPIAKPERIEFVEALPKTRSGKIMRRVLKARAQGLPEGDVSTLEQ